MEGGVRHARLVIGFAALPVMAQHPWGVAAKRGGKHRMGIESPLRRRGEVRGSCVKSGGVEEAIAGEQDAPRNGTCPARGEGLGRKIAIAGVDENAAVDVGGMYLRAPKVNSRGLAEGAAGEGSLDGGERLLELRRVDGDAICGEIDTWMEIPRWSDGWRRRAVETVSEGRSRAWEPEGRAGEKETT
ncbi:hypothetical protein B0H14DRAFT_3575587 [Mycena olivaceomarginata]|nr:hypothetical protein B0H14DRAFT_3575587 [Mycena olivaceomarginata]